MLLARIEKENVSLLLGVRPCVEIGQLVSLETLAVVITLFVCVIEDIIHLLVVDDHVAGNHCSARKDHHDDKHDLQIIHIIIRESEHLIECRDGNKDYRIHGYTEKKVHLVEYAAEHDGKNVQAPESHIIAVPEREASAYGCKCKRTYGALCVIVEALGSVDEKRSDRSRKVDNRGKNDPECDVQSYIIGNIISEITDSKNNHTRKKAERRQLEKYLDDFTSRYILRFVHS